MLNYVCADCGHHQDSMGKPCEVCYSFRVVQVDLIKKIVGENYMECFNSKEAFPKHKI